MANEHSSKPLAQTLFPLETCPQVSDEDFNLFHTIDRELYARLVQNLGRETAESVQVMGFWMWLERETNDTKLIHRLLSLPLLLLNELAEETRVCLMCLETDKLQFSGEITLLPEILNCPVISLRFFHENRVAILRSVAKIISTVCVRAFRDIRRGINEAGESSRAAPPVMPMAPFVSLHPALIQSAAAGQLPIHLGSFPAFDLAAQRHGMVNRDENGGGRNLGISVDDRTIFLTFSKGYPIAEDEVKEYFTRRFGDFVESLISQEVGGEEQVLYARMVVKAEAVAVMEEIAPGRGKAKYTINGKHVWARKYVKKSRSPPRDGRSGAAANSTS